MKEQKEICSICEGDFDLDGEGGIVGDLGVLPVAFCPFCLSGVTDLAEQLMEGEEMDIELARYIASYVNEELERNNNINRNTIMYAVDAFNGGAR